jgi:Holliday junction resolvasome RuvABC endonuclease subunit
MNKKPIILTLDLGTTTGWALINKNEIIMSGTTSFNNRRFDGGGMRFMRFMRWLDETLVLLGEIDSVYFEEVRRHIGMDAAHVYGGFMASLTAWCESHNIPYEGIPVGTIKKFITGKGNAGKQAVIAAVEARGHKPEDNNEADAIALLYCVLENRKNELKL